MFVHSDGGDAACVVFSFVAVALRGMHACVGRRMSARSEETVFLTVTLPVSLSSCRGSRWDALACVAVCVWVSWVFVWG